ncbi:hypothetical protein ACIRD6_36955 [Streptomyces sp. NPDC102473]
MTSQLPRRVGAAGDDRPRAGFVIEADLTGQLESLGDGTTPPARLTV